MAKTQKVVLRSRVPDLMKAAGICSAAELKRRTGLGYATAYRLTLGEVPSRASTIAQLCDALGCQPGDLFGT